MPTTRIESLAMLCADGGKGDLTKEYGTARKGGKENDVKDLEVSAPIDTDREFIEEIEDKDVRLIGVNGLVEKRTANHGKCLKVELDKKFFHVAVKQGNKITTTETDKEEFLGRHGVRYFQERLPAGVRFVVIMDGSVAQQVRTNVMKPD